MSDLTASADRSRPRTRWGWFVALGIAQLVLGIIAWFDVIAFTIAGVIFIGTALPEEILFRALIQNLLMLRFGAGMRTLLVASFIFGCAHLNNGPLPLPNWRYMIVATIAGFAYGRVFQRASTVLSSAALHTLVDWTKHFFF